MHASECLFYCGFIYLSEVDIKWTYQILRIGSLVQKLALKYFLPHLKKTNKTSWPIIKNFYTMSGCFSSNEG